MNYDITIRDSFDRLRETVESAGCRNRRLCLITDDHVSNYYLCDVYDILLEISPEVKLMALYAGEQNKTTDALNGIYDALIRHNYDKEDYIIALGGGSVCEIAGFAAATFREGMKFFMIPTSLCAQVYSSTFGRVGVDYRYHRNLIGMKYDPCHVYINTSLLRTLKEEDLATGMAEVLRTGFSASSDLLDYLENNLEDIHSGKEALGEMIRLCVSLNERIDSEQDCFGSEFGGFGAVIGRAFCDYFGYDKKYGECMSLGIASALALSHKKGALRQEDQKRLLKLMADCGLKTRIPGVDAAAVAKLIASGNDSFYSLSLLSGSGSVYRDNTITREELTEAIGTINEG